ncbi:MAG TPA: S-methyl-5-thioribose-1-phosphate isomerase [Thermoanaerobaculia bacterium]|nr:S-methyl-5-thioribose-1-phosphate isomerase [Thermoanaerobaculia bacterium]
MKSAAPFTPIRFASGKLALLDQTRLPAEEVWLDCPDVETVADAIRRLAVRGAPAIGVAAAWGLVVAVNAPPGADEATLSRRFDAAWQLLAGTRPTAVNLRWALDQGRRVWQQGIPNGVDAARAALAAWAARVQAEDLAANQRMGEHGATLFATGDRALTHCNAGALATAGYGTAIGVLTSAWNAGRLAKVWVDETRPLLQGARLTAWELGRLGIPYRLITDSSAGSLIARGEVDRIVVGADRIARNGDTANKIGTYPLAVLAARHRIPFYVAAPLSTVDLATPNGDAIPIEERRPEEVTALSGNRTTPDDAAALNLAFDVTPAELISAIITEAGVLEPPYELSLSRAVTGALDAQS